jgi:hypothetical protein
MSKNWSFRVSCVLCILLSVALVAASAILVAGCLKEQDVPSYPIQTPQQRNIVFWLALVIALTLASTCVCCTTHHALDTQDWNALRLVTCKLFGTSMSHPEIQILSPVSEHGKGGSTRTNYTQLADVPEAGGNEVEEKEEHEEDSEPKPQHENQQNESQVHSPPTATVPQDGYQSTGSNGSFVNIQSPAPFGSGLI